MMGKQPNDVHSCLSDERDWLNYVHPTLLADSCRWNKNAKSVASACFTESTSLMCDANQSLSTPAGNIGLALGSMLAAT